MPEQVRYRFQTHEQFLPKKVQNRLAHVTTLNALVNAKVIEQQPAYTLMIRLVTIKL